MSQKEIFPLRCGIFAKIRLTDKHTCVHSFNFNDTKDKKVEKQAYNGVISLTEMEVFDLADSLRHHSVKTTQIEMVPWAKEDTVDVKDVFTELTLEKIEYQPSAVEHLVTTSYKDIYQLRVESSGSDSESEDEDIRAYFLDQLMGRIRQGREDATKAGNDDKSLPQQLMSSELNLNQAQADLMSLGLNPYKQLMPHQLLQMPPRQNLDPQGLRDMIQQPNLQKRFLQLMSLAMEHQPPVLHSEQNLSQQLTKLVPQQVLKLMAGPNPNEQLSQIEALNERTRQLFGSFMKDIQENNFERALAKDQELKSIEESFNKIPALRPLFQLSGEDSESEDAMSVSSGTSAEWTTCSSEQSESSSHTSNDWPLSDGIPEIEDESRIYQLKMHIPNGQSDNYSDSTDESVGNPSSCLSQVENQVIEAQVSDKYSQPDSVNDIAEYVAH